MRLLLLPIVALLGACSTVPTPFAAEGSTVDIPNGVHVGRLLAVPQVLLEDSRCPSNARCVWAGRVVLSTRIYGPDFDETVPLILGERRHVRSVDIDALVEPGAGHAVDRGRWRGGTAGESKRG